LCAFEAIDHGLSLFAAAEADIAFSQIGGSPDGSGYVSLKIRASPSSEPFRSGSASA
jgi:hypothetical protein